jgi:hypothetical protein
MELLGDVGQLEGRFGVNLSEIDAGFVPKSTLGMKIVLGVPDQSPR